MKVTEHVEHLLRQGRKPVELVELGFPNSVVTRVRRRLREEKAAQRTLVPKGGHDVKDHRAVLAALRDELAVMHKKLVSLESHLQGMDEALGVLKTRLDGSPSAGLKARFECTQCGARGLLATYIKCTKCGNANWWGWWPEK
jgi:hypothetical protein